MCSGSFRAAHVQRYWHVIGKRNACEKRAAWSVDVWWVEVGGLGGVWGGGWERRVIANLGSSINSPVFAQLAARTLPAHLSDYQLATSTAPAAVDQPDCALLAGLLCWAAVAEFKQPHGAFFGGLFFLADCFATDLLQLQ